MRVAIIGSGGREHAIAWKVGQDVPRRQDVFVLPGNGGTTNNVPIDPGDLDAIEAFCLERSIDLVLVGPEVPLAAGIVDRLSARGVRVFGPTSAGARLEGSKIWAKRFMRRHGVPTAGFQVFGDPSDALVYAREIGGEAVVKLDGLAAGKGVFVCRGLDEVTTAISTVRATWGDDAPFLVERCLRGNELSVIGFTDGEHVALLTPSQDHKQVFDGDRGPNTGGMGAFCPVPACDMDLLEQVRDQVVTPTLLGLQAEGIDYRGVIYFGLMVTPQGPQLLEYNVRLGDPEAEVVLPALESSLLEVVDACLEGTLDRCQLRFTDGYHVDVVLAAQGYPGAYEKGHEITGLDQVDPGTLVFHAGTRRDGDRVLTAGGRVLNVVAHGDDLDDAITRAYTQCERIRFEGKFHRADIGRRSWTTANEESVDRHVSDPEEHWKKRCEKSWEEGVRGRNTSPEGFLPRSCLHRATRGGSPWTSRKRWPAGRS